jgi:hypothetical protein
VSAVQEKTINGNTVREVAAKAESINGEKIDPYIDALANKEARGLLTAGERDLIETGLDPDEYNAFQRRVGEVERKLETDETLNATREKSIKAFVERERAEYEARLKDELDVETRNEIERQRGEGRVMPPDQVEAYRLKPHDDSSIAALEEDVATLEQDLLRSVDEEERPLMEEAIKAEFEKAKEGSAEKAVDQAIPCVSKKAAKL